MGMILVVKEDGIYAPVIDHKEYASVEELRKDIRNNGNDFLRDTDYTLVEKKPVLRVTIEEKIKIKEV